MATTCFPQEAQAGTVKLVYTIRKLLAIYEPVKYFGHMLDARHFTVLTDHKLFTFSHQKRDKCSLRHFNHLDFISHFTTDIRHISGQDNIVADALSWVEAISAPVTHDALAAAKDDEIVRSW